LLSVSGEFGFWDIRMTKPALCEARTAYVPPLILGANCLGHVIEHVISRLKVFAVFGHCGKLGLTCLTPTTRKIPVTAGFSLRAGRTRAVYAENLANTPHVKQTETMQLSASERFLNLLGE
jgi:hypothetical protein